MQVRKSYRNESYHETIDIVIENLIRDNWCIWDRFNEFFAKLL